MCFGVLAGFIGCVAAPFIGSGDQTRVLNHSEMTLTLCREFCFAADTNHFKFKYLAVSGPECTCFSKLEDDG